MNIKEAVGEIKLLDSLFSFCNTTNKFKQFFRKSNQYHCPKCFLGHKNDRLGGVDALPRDVDARLRDVDAHFGHVDAPPRLVDAVLRGVEARFGDVDVHPRLPNDRADDVNDQINPLTNY